LGPLLAAGGGKKLGLLIYRPDPRDLGALVELFAAGKVTPVIDRTYPLAETAEALRSIGAGEVCGKVVIAVRP
jgi:NADPH:quinone reductase-like Zn-dependent oxidoreductase